MGRGMVLCAGLGTRLRPLTLECPKPLVPVGDRPLLGHIVDRLRPLGLGRLVVNVHHLPAEFESRSKALGLDFDVIHELEIRGTAGGVAGARAHFDGDPVLIYNGDILTQPSPELLAPLAGVRLAVAPRPCGQGTVGVDARGNVVRLRGERFAEEVAGGDYVGVLALGHEGLSELPSRGCLIGDLCLPRLRAGRPVETLAHGETWSDLGTLQDYLQANLEWLRHSSERSWRGPGSTIEAGVTVHQSVLGAGCQVRGEGALREVVVWPGAVALAPASRCVFTPRGRVDIPG